MAAELTAKRVNQLLDYCPETGIFYWKVNRGQARIGAIAGTMKKDGYIELRIDYGYYRAHRIAWLVVHGVMPDYVIDHINGNTTDNRISNLRLATVEQNAQHKTKPPKNCSGLRGVTFCKNSGKWRATIKANKVYYYLGKYANKEDAAIAYADASKLLHKEFRALTNSAT